MRKPVWGMALAVLLAAMGSGDARAQTLQGRTISLGESQFQFGGPLFGAPLTRVRDFDVKNYQSMLRYQTADFDVAGTQRYFTVVAMNQLDPSYIAGKRTLPREVARSMTRKDWDPEMVGQVGTTPSPLGPWAWQRYTLKQQPGTA